jgi:RNA-directed DNA polymerase
MINGVFAETEEGTPQGENLSPLLSNIMLNELDNELTKRGLKFLGFAFYHVKGGVGIRVHSKAVKKFKDKLKEATGRSKARSANEIIHKLKQIITGWVNYFKIADVKSLLKEMDEWLRRRIRMCYWKRWKKIKTKHDNLVKQSTLILIEPPYTEPFVRWCERSVAEIISYLLLD